MRGWDRVTEEWIPIRIDAAGRLEVRTLATGLPGQILTDQVTVGAPGYAFLSAVDVDVRGVAIKALAGNTGTVYVIEQGKTGNTQGYPLAASEVVNLGINNLSRVRLYFDTAADRVAYLAIAS